jgi:hypothetical protein
MRKVRRRSKSKSRVRRSVRRSRVRRSRNRTVKRTAKRTVKRRNPKKSKSYNEYLDYFRGRVSPMRGGCIDKSYLKKYATRPGPSYAAQDCKGEIRNGNDGLMYISVSSRNGVYRWQKL